MSKTPLLVKVEIPFCVRPCDFCSRSVIEGWDSTRMSAYCEALMSEIAANAAEFEDCEIVAIRYGGGTASNAGAGIADIARCIRDNYHVADNVEVTMRAAISNMSGATMPMFKRAGINRLDFEMLSLYQMNFASLNKVDRFEDFGIICDNFLHSYANDMLGLVLLYGLEGMSQIDFRRSALAAASTHVSHVELFCTAEGSRADDEAVNQHLLDAREVFAEKGLKEYRNGCFAREGCEDRFLSERDNGMDVLAFGLGACTRFEGVASTNTDNLGLYLEHSADYTAITVDVESI